MKNTKILLAILSSCLLLAWSDNNLDVFRLDSIPLDLARPVQNPITNTVDSIWASLSQELQLDHKVQSVRVKAEIRKLLADQEKLYSILEAAAPYIYYIHQQIRYRGLPVELALIPAIESEFNPNDHSNKGATGLWQLMPGTAKELGIKVKSGYDGRRNVVASTKAALAYFNDLGNSFKGNWYLAIAAYNCGQVCIQSSERRTGSHSFWDLPLPQETKYYVPRLLAVAAIIKNPEKYGVQLPPIDNTPYFTEVKVNKPVALSTIAETAGISIKTLKTLNPDYNHGSIPASPNKAAALLVPVRKAAIVSQQLAKPLPKTIVITKVKTKTRRIKS